MTTQKEETFFSRISQEDLLAVSYLILILIGNILISIGLFLILEFSSSFIDKNANVSNILMLVLSILGVLLAVARFFLSYWLGRKWKKIHQYNITSFHWLIANTIYLLVIIGLIFLAQAIFPYVKEIFLWPFSSLPFLTSFDLFVVLLGVFTLIDSISLKGNQGDGTFLLMFIVIGLFIILLFPSFLIPSVLLKLGYDSGKKQRRKDNTQT